MAAADPRPLPTVQGLDLKKYMGRWYEIAQMPSRFQPSDTTNTRATYTLKPDGSVGVLNETFKGDGSLVSISGTAVKNDKDSADAKFTVQFWVPPFLPVIPSKGDYWVIDIAEDYSYALVGQPKREYLWVLSREASLQDDIYTKLLQMAQANGYDTSKLKKTTHLPNINTEDPAKKDFWWWLAGVFGQGGTREKPSQ